MDQCGSPLLPFIALVLVMLAVLEFLAVFSTMMDWISVATVNYIHNEEGSSAVVTLFTM